MLVSLVKSCELEFATAVTLPAITPVLSSTVSFLQPEILPTKGPVSLIWSCYSGSFLMAAWDMVSFKQLVFYFGRCRLCSMGRDNWFAERKVQQDVNPVQCEDSLPALLLRASARSPVSICIATHKAQYCNLRVCQCPNAGIAQTAREMQRPSAAR